MAARRAARVDQNQPELVKAARQLGALVILTHTVGGQCPDFWIWWRGRWLAIEDKTRTGRLKAKQREVQSLWPGAVHVVRTVEELVKLMGSVV